MALGVVVGWVQPSLWLASQRPTGWMGMLGGIGGKTAAGKWTYGGAAAEILGF